MRYLFTSIIFLIFYATIFSQNNPAPFIGTNLTRGDNLLILRLAVSVRGEFTQATGGVAAVETQINNWLPRINEIYGREYAVRFELIPNNSQLIFTDAATDPWETIPDGSAGCDFNDLILSRQATVIDSIIGAANYDFSHVILGNFNGGCAGGYKSGFSGGFDIGVTRHEMGHQFQQGHTISNGGNNNFEPQNAGRSIQGGNSDPFAHSRSFHQLANHIAVTEAGVGTPIVTGNTIPTANAGPDRTIPFGTPFTLSATATDPDAGDVLTYVWDQLDAGIQQNLPPGDDTQGALFTRFIPTTTNSRTYPNLDSLLANIYTSNLEHLPTQARDLNFRLTVNDNHRFLYQGNMVNASGSNNDDVKITITNTGPFQVTAPNTNVVFTGGTNQNITWDVNGTNAAPINTTNVKISLSNDGGRTFPIILANSTPNDGAATVTLPNINTNQARIKVEAIDNIYFDISNQNFTINQNPNIAGINIAISGANTLVSETGQTDTYTIALLTNPTGPVEVTLTADAQSEISLNGINFSPTIVVSFNNTSAQTVTVRGRFDNVTEGPQIGQINHVVTATNDGANYPIGVPGSTVPVNISDAQIPPVIGVDFDEASSTNVPDFWNLLTPIAGQAVTATNLSLDDETPTSIDFSATARRCGIGGCAFDWSPSPGLPQHVQPLSRYGGLSVSRDSFVAIWSDLKPNTKYRTYVFATGFIGGINQTVTITGNGSDNPPPFAQSGGGPNTVFINDQISSTQTLINFGKEVTSNNAGIIEIKVKPNVNGGESNISAMAIQEVLGAPTSPMGVQVSAKAFLEGPYNNGLMNDDLRTGNLIPNAEPYAANNNFIHLTGGETVATNILATTGNNAIVDWVLLELRNGADNAQIQHTRAALLQRDGDIVDMDGISPVTFPQATTGNYYVVVRHRNHLGIMSNVAISLSSTTTNIDFTLATTPTFGTNARKDLGNNTLGLYAADINASGTVDAADRNTAWNNRNQTGYLGSDVDMSGTTAASDRSITWNNRNQVQQIVSSIGIE